MSGIRIKAAAACPKIRAADTRFNADSIIEIINNAAEDGVRICLFPELALTGSTCGDLFLQDALIDASNAELSRICRETQSLPIVSVIGLPRRIDGVLYDCAAVIRSGKILNVFAKDELSPSERRWFSAGEREGTFEIDGIKYAVTFGSTVTAAKDADIVLRLSSEPAVAGSARVITNSVSAEAKSRGVIYACAGEGESTTDHVFDGLCLIASPDGILAEMRFENGYVSAEIDAPDGADRTKNVILPESAKRLEQNPWIPADEKLLPEYLDEILTLQCLGLKRRAEHTNTKKFIVGVSGGLDSTLAMLVCAKTAKLMGLPEDALLAVTMPCFGTTSRTKSNAVILSECLGAELRTVNIGDAVLQHFADIGHDFDKHNAAFENSQARERTQVLMDIANDAGGMVVGTGDMSELALGWATYNGDHMSMYGVNGGIPKTVIRLAVRRAADTCGNEILKNTLLDIIDTPVSPELLPAKDGEISQKTEDLVGPYELHDFFMWHVLSGMAPREVRKKARTAFDGIYDDETVVKWLRNFIRRFFSQQFKRSCLPDGPQVLDWSLSPRGGLVMPSDGISAAWLAQLDD